MKQTVLCGMITYLVWSSGAHADELFDEIKPVAGRDVAKPMKPDWCNTADVSRWQGDDPKLALRAGQRAVNSGYDEKTLRTIAQIACARPDDPTYQSAIASWRQGWINLSGISETEDREAEKVRASTDYDKLKSEFCDALEPGAEASPEEKSVAGAFMRAANCNDHADLGLLGWWVDKRAEPDSELARAYFTYSCLAGPEPDKPRDPKDTFAMRSFAVCGTDGRRLDKGRLEKEIAGKPFNAYGRIYARETFAAAKTTYARLAEAYEKLAAKDEGYKKLLFDGPEAGWKAWEQAYAANKAAFEAARAYEAKFYAGSKKALAGCEGPLLKNFGDYLRAQKPKTEAEAVKAASDAIGQVLLAPLALCEAVEGRKQAAFTLNDFLHGKRPRRGPRMAAYHQALDVLSDILADRARFPINVQDFRSPVEEPGQGSGSMDDAVFELVNPNQDNPPKGVIAGVAKKGNGVQITFKAESHIENTYHCTPTNRIDRIESNGQVRYVENCAINGTTKVVTEETPLVVDAPFAEGLKPGQHARFTVQAAFRDPARVGFPAAIYADKDLKRLVVWYGVAL